MNFKRNFLASAAFALASAMSWGQGALPIGEHFWPTPNRAFLDGRPLETVLQPTASGNLSSALFGCVRNNGSRFHEGVDLRPVARDSRGEALDPVYAFDAGVVRHVSRRPGASSYGRYIVVEHPQILPGLVTLYAHLSSIPDSIAEGVSLRGGQEIAVMGRSAGGYSIPRERAHLHFEAGFWLGPRFQYWYDQQSFGSANEHGSYNGMNIVGLDVWSLFAALRRGEVRNVRDFIASEPVAVEAFIPSASIPELLEVNPYLMESMSLPQNQAGWRVGFTWYGLPVQFEALAPNQAPEGTGVSVRTLRPDLLAGKPCLEMARDGRPGTKLSSVIGRLFID